MYLFQRLIEVQKAPAARVADVRPRRLEEDSYGLPAKSGVMHGNTVKRILLLLKWPLLPLSQSYCFVPTVLFFHKWIGHLPSDSLE